MTKSRYDKPFIELGQLITYDHFRTVESFDMNRCPTEVKATLELKPPFMESLTFALPWDGLVFAYVRFTDGYKKICEDAGLNPKRTEVFLNDWDDRFQLQIEDDFGRSTLSVFVTTEDVHSLLELCCRIPSQNRPKETVNQHSTNS